MTDPRVAGGRPRGGRTRAAVAGALAACAVAAGLAVQPQSAAGGPLAQTAQLGDRKLKLGMKGRDVRQLQKSLTRLKAPTAVDGQFGKGTRRSVIAIERRFSWRPVNGKVSATEGKRIRRKVEKQRQKKQPTSSSSDYRFPIPGPHNYGGSQARFGAARSGHKHQGQDIFAACGEPLMNVHPGTVKAKAYQGGGAGDYLVVRGKDGTDYAYMHLRQASWAAKGTKLYAGQQIGRVGDSGNASGCHLHFEMWASPGWYSGGKPFDPYPYLKQWDQYS